MKGRKKEITPGTDLVRSRIVEFISNEVGDQESLADVKTAGLWDGVRTNHVTERIEAGAKRGMLGYWYSRLSYYRPDLIPVFKESVVRAGFRLPAELEPIQWLRPALNAFLLSPEALDITKTLFDHTPSDRPSYLSDLAELLPPPSARYLANLIAYGYGPQIRAAELKPTLARAVRISSDASNWLINWVYFHRRDLFLELRRVAHELDAEAGRRQATFDEEAGLEKVDDEWTQLAPSLTARMLRRLLGVAEAGNFVATVVERVHRHRPDLVQVIERWRAKKRT